MASPPESDEFHVLDPRTQTIVTGQTMEQLIERVRKNWTRHALGNVGYEIARALVCDKYPEECRAVPMGIVEATHHLVASVSKWQKAGRPMVSDEVFSLRQTACQACPHNRGWKSIGVMWCALCRCSTAKLSLKLRMPTEKCPDHPSRWPSVEP